MENQPEEDHRDESYVLYSPCKFIEQLIKAFLKCLGGHVDDSSSACPKSDQQEDLDNPPPADNNETQMKSAVLSLSSPYIFWFIYFVCVYA